MENAEEIFQSLDDFSKRKPKTIPRELEDYLAYVARTGDPVYQWSVVKCLFKEKLLNVITEFYETSPGLDIPHCPNVDPFNYDSMKNSLVEKIDSFSSAPFTVQRICELLTTPRKQYNRIDKFMRAIEKNVLVVSTREPGVQRHVEQENGEQIEPMVNGSDNNSDYNVDVEMEEISWKETLERHNTQPQPGSSDGHISVDDIEARLQAKQDITTISQEKVATEYESVTPPELNISVDENISQIKTIDETNFVSSSSTMVDEKEKTETTQNADTPAILQQNTENKTEIPIAMLIPEITIDDAEMTEQKLTDKATEEAIPIDTTQAVTTEKVIDDAANDNKENNPQLTIEDNNVQSTMDEANIEIDVRETHTNEPKHISEVITSSEESSSSSDNTDGNSNSPKTDNENPIDAQEESNQFDVTSEEETSKNQLETVSLATVPDPVDTSYNIEENVAPQVIIQTDDYSISDVKSELPKSSPEIVKEITAETVEKVIDGPLDADNSINKPEPEEIELQEEIKES